MFMNTFLHLRTLALPGKGEVWYQRQVLPAQNQFRSLPRIIEESTSATADPWYALISPWKLMAYFYPQLHVIIRRIRIRI